MRFTRSQDGVERATVHIALRLSREEIASIKAAAKKDGRDGDWRDWIASHAALAIEGELVDEDGSYEQRYGKGDA